MGFKSLKLKRTNIFYPTNGNHRNMGGLLRNLTITDEILDDILDLEDESYQDDKQGASEQELSLLLKNASRDIQIPPEKIVKIYLHILRGGGVPKTITRTNLEYLKIAYDQLLPIFGTSSFKANFRKYDGLLLFGKYSDLNINKTDIGLHEYKQYYKTYMQVNKYTFMGGMLEKVEKFEPFSQDLAIVNRIYDILTSTKFRHYDTDNPEAYSVSSLHFWGMLLIILLNEDTKFKIVDEFFGNKDSIMLFEEHLKHLPYYIEATSDSKLVKYFNAKMGAVGA